VAKVSIFPPLSLIVMLRPTFVPSSFNFAGKQRPCYAPDTLPEDSSTNSLMFVICVRPSCREFALQEGYALFSPLVWVLCFVPPEHRHPLVTASCSRLQLTSSKLKLAGASRSSPPPFSTIKVEPFNLIDAVRDVDNTPIYYLCSFIHVIRDHDLS
jgi:hypothetical protein